MVCCYGLVCWFGVVWCSAAVVLLCCVVLRGAARTEADGHSPSLSLSLKCGTWGSEGHVPVESQGGGCPRDPRVEGHVSGSHGLENSENLAPTTTPQHHTTKSHHQIESMEFV